MAPSRYKILQQVGQGQFGIVYSALDQETGQLVALKALDKRGIPTRLFLRELGCLARLQHPNIVTLQTIAYDEGDRYLVMEYCEGGTLRQLLDMSISHSLGQRLQLIIDVLKGLEMAHQLGIVHCDIKPENILLTFTPERCLARVTDFGIARLAMEAGYQSKGLGGDTGSPAYMAPERFYSQYSYASDLYAVGVILFELAVGRRPFTGLPGQLMTAHLSQAVQIPEEVPFLLRSVLDTALQKLPQNRYKSTTAMLKAVQLAANVIVLGEPKLDLRSLLSRSQSEDDDTIALGPLAPSQTQPVAQ
ncbi:MAG: serine/threonine protein kinase [Acaryochloridaceae cyanobacterium SU_2_1]|nr:serine/threonine protein kinase [Acaryochloridaceae cyanobacterium SU_2_1]